MEKLLLPTLGKTSASSKRTEHLTNSLDKQRAGQQAEEFVAQWLLKEGYTIVARNYRARPGEIDIIARQKNLYIFVEVKRRARDDIALSEVITRAKQRAVVKAAQRFLLAGGLASTTIARFDVALVIGSAQAPEVQYIPDAFTSVEYGSY